MESSERTKLVAVAAQMAAMEAEYMDENANGKPEAKLLTKDESEKESASGFISHARRDPERRSDPGEEFPWEDFFEEYKKRI